MGIYPGHWTLCNRLIKFMLGFSSCCSLLVWYYVVIWSVLSWLMPKRPKKIHHTKSWLSNEKASLSWRKLIRKLLMHSEMKTFFTSKWPRRNFSSEATHFVIDVMKTVQCQFELTIAIIMNRVKKVYVTLVTVNDARIDTVSLQC